MAIAEFKFEGQAAVAIVGIIAAGIAIIGNNPLAPASELSGWERGGLGALGAVCLLLFLFWYRSQTSSGVDPGVVDPDYKARFDAAQLRIREITPEDRIIDHITINGIKFDVINGNILDSKDEIIVSSDDNRFTAAGGVAHAIVSKAGAPIIKELAQYKKRKFRQGQLAVTSAGYLDRYCIFHHVVIDHDENRYPDEETIEKIVYRSLLYRSLQCAVTLGASSIAFPVLGGGTATKTLMPSDSVRVIVRSILEYLNQTSTAKDSLSYIALYIFDKRDADGVSQLVHPSHRSAKRSR
jgi:O-acetyl-ADP-ribose deacetylase (regulator of RNase III)